MRAVTSREVDLCTLDGVAVKSPTGETVKLTTAAFLRDRTRDAQFSKGIDQIERAMRIRAAKVEAGELLLEEDDWALLCFVTRNPSDGYNPEIAHLCLEFARDILSARAC